jgi:hypothetical protein
VSFGNEVRTQTVTQMLADTLELRRKHKRENPNPKLPTNAERLLMRHQMYVNADSMGSKHTPLYRGNDV